VVSHFFVAVLTRTGSLEEVELLLAPYDENISVPEYEEDCFCVGRAARDEARKAAEAEIGTLESLGASFRDAHGDKPSMWAFSDEAQLLWQKRLAQFNAAEEKAFQQHPLRHAPDSSCEECRGTGKRTSTYNPRSRWDWWVVGGRWNGEIAGNPHDDGDGGFNYGDEFHRIENNQIPVPEVLARDMLPFAIVTPDGEWHEKGEMMWFGMVANMREDWPQRARDLLERHLDCIAVGVDCHI